MRNLRARLRQLERSKSAELSAQQGDDEPPIWLIRQAILFDAPAMALVDEQRELLVAGDAEKQAGLIPRLQARIESIWLQVKERYRAGFY